jgi:hypothetical protein
LAKNGKYSKRPGATVQAHQAVPHAMRKLTEPKEIKMSRKHAPYELIVVALPVTAVSLQ